MLELNFQLKMQFEILWNQDVEPIYQTVKKLKFTTADQKFKTTQTKSEP